MIDELINLLLHLGIEHDFDLLGHSWGGVLAMEFVVRRQFMTKGLRRLVLASAFAETRVYNKSFAALVDAFSDDVKKALYGGLTPENATRFKRALYEVFAVHGCRVPWTDDLLRVWTRASRTLPPTMLCEPSCCHA
jgi:pimeloyl-ACP methyl ester carboxylesterase